MVHDLDTLAGVGYMNYQKEEDGNQKFTTWLLG